MGFLAPVGAAIASAVGGMSASTALTVGSSVLGAGSALMQGMQQSKMYKYQAQVANNQAEAQRQQANLALIAGQRQESLQRLKAGQIREERRAATAANGIDVDYGTPKLIDNADEAIADFDALTLRFNAAREAYGARQAEQNARMEAAQARSSAKNAKLASFIGAASSLIGGASKLSSMNAANKAAFGDLHVNVTPRKWDPILRGA